MLKEIKKVAQQTSLAEVPACVVFGSVTAIAPLTVMVDSRFELKAPALVALRPARDHRHVLTDKETENDELSGFKKGDWLALLRNQGGQQYFVIGRV